MHFMRWFHRHFCENLKCVNKNKVGWWQIKIKQFEKIKQTKTTESTPKWILCSRIWTPNWQQFQTWFRMQSKTMAKEIELIKFHFIRNHMAAQIAKFNHNTFTIIFDSSSYWREERCVHVYRCNMCARCLAGSIYFLRFCSFAGRSNNLFLVCIRFIGLEPPFIWI